MNAEGQVGLVTKDKAVPLEGVRIEAKLSGACVDVTVTQRFRNRERVPVEAVYVFPLEESAAVCGFAALVGGKLLRGQVCERDAAFAKYDDAMLEGDGAFLLDQERPNVFTASVGNLRPGEQVELQIRYVALAAREGNAVRLAIPTTVSPRYVPDGPSEVGEPDAERINPEKWPDVPYGLTLGVDIQGTELARVESPSHPIRTTLSGDGARVELSQEDVALDRDFVLLVERRQPQQPEVRVAREPDGRRVAMLSFMPAWNVSAEQGHEVLFVLDCSGSMEGESIAQAKRALALCVRALRSEDSFNVVCFGSTFHTLWPKPRPFDDGSLEEATQHVSQIAADMGGTEILAPLASMLELPKDSARARRVLVLTDGQVGNEADVLELARKHADDTRIFAFGIGAGVSEYLVRGMARASRGASCFIHPGERIEPKVLSMFARVRMPVLDDVRVDYRGATVEQAPRRTPPVFTDDMLTVFARIESGSPASVELVAGDLNLTVPIDLERAEGGGPIPTLWARECIRELDDLDTRGGSQQRREKSDEARRARLVELGTRYGLLSSATSYVAVEERSPSDKPTTPAELRRIPVALTSGWGGSREPMRGGAPRLMAMAMPISAAAPMRKRSAPFAPVASAAPGFIARAAQSVFSALGGGGDSTFSDMDEPPDLTVGAAPDAFWDERSDRVFDLLMTQRADGSFEVSDVLEEWLGRERHERLREACASQGEALVVTSVVIALLEREEAGRASEWTPAVNKARAWLAKQGGAFDAAAVL
jgi:Ca-activated chloride channel family protein